MRKLKLLPPMRCDDGCGECCGLVPATETEFQRIGRYATEHGIQPVDQAETCPWFQGGKCSVYPVRPLACRLFGHVPGMPCPKGYNTNIPERDAHRMVRANGMSSRILHEALPDGYLREAFKEMGESYALRIS
jgi:Fe-S-cluster containining protein